jgi:hypothetical protein
MSKITFRADEELVERLEAFDASKSEVMRDALRAYLDDAEANDGGGDDTGGSADAGVDAALAERVDELIAERLDEHLDRRGRREYGRAPAPTQAPAPARAQDVNVNVTLDGVAAEVSDETEVSDDVVDAADEPTPDQESRKTAAANADDGEPEARNTCNQCGENMDSGHVYCPNCGEKANHRVFCDCGDEIRSDWAFCPGCGRRTPAADVLEGPDRP